MSECQKKLDAKNPLAIGRVNEIFMRFENSNYLVLFQSNVKIFSHSHDFKGNYDSVLIPIKNEEYLVCLSNLLNSSFFISVNKTPSHSFYKLKQIFNLKEMYDNQVKINFLLVFFFVVLSFFWSCLSFNHSKLYIIKLLKFLNYLNHEMGCLNKEIVLEEYINLRSVGYRLDFDVLNKILETICVSPNISNEI